jgi:exodeoxyribonuclease V alpha subunit
MTNASPSMSASAHPMRQGRAMRAAGVLSESRDPTFDAFEAGIRAGLRRWDLAPTLFDLSVELVSRHPALKDNQARPLMTLMTLLLAEEAKGQSFVPSDPTWLNETLSQWFDAPSLLEEQIQGIQALAEARTETKWISPDASDVAAIVVQSDRFQTIRTRKTEDKVASELQGRLVQTRKKWNIDPRFEAPVFSSLSASQADAVQHALNQTLTVITGGPGTGKTFVVASILRAMLTQGIPPGRIALSAPTGRAAFRMSTAIRDTQRSDSDDDALLSALHQIQASTLHRLLGFRPHSGTFRYGAHERLPLDVLVVDECSMIELELFERLLCALEPETRLILMGDPDQLPSIGAGQVLKDLAETSALTQVRVHLSENFRMRHSNPAGRQILELAEAIRTGNLSSIMDLLEPRQYVAEQIRFRGTEWLDASSEHEQAAFIARCYQKFFDGPEWFGSVWPVSVFRGPNGLSEVDCLRLERGFHRIEQFKCLTVSRTRLEGSASAPLNATFHTLTQAFFPRDEHDLFPGEPVIVESNDYSLGLLNGDTGLVVQLQDTGSTETRRCVAFRDGEDGFRFFPLEAVMHRISLGYAITVHKAQGSEYESAVLFMPSTPSDPSFQRALLYTAATRSTSSFTLVGARPSLEAGASRKEIRRSGLSTLLTPAKEVDSKA